MRLRSLKYASSFISNNENDVNLAVVSPVKDAHNLTRYVHSRVITATSF